MGLLGQAYMIRPGCPALAFYFLLILHDLFRTVYKKLNWLDSCCSLNTIFIIVAICIYIRQVNGVKLADIVFPLVFVSVCVRAHMAAVFHTQYIQSYKLQI